MGDLRLLTALGLAAGVGALAAIWVCWEAWGRDQAARLQVLRRDRAWVADFMARAAKVFVERGGMTVPMALASAAALYDAEMEDPTGTAPEDLAWEELSYWTDDDEGGARD